MKHPKTRAERRIANRHFSGKDYAKQWRWRINIYERNRFGFRVGTNYLFSKLKERETITERNHQEKDKMNGQENIHDKLRFQGIGPSNGQSTSEALQGPGQRNASATAFKAILRYEFYRVVDMVNTILNLQTTYVFEISRRGKEVVHSIPNLPGIEFVAVSPKFYDEERPVFCRRVDEYAFKPYDHNDFTVVVSQILKDITQLEADMKLTKNNSSPKSNIESLVQEDIVDRIAAKTGKPTNLREMFESWVKHDRAKWDTEESFQAYCAGVLDAKTELNTQNAEPVNQESGPPKNSMAERIKNLTANVPMSRLLEDAYNDFNKLINSNPRPSYDVRNVLFDILCVWATEKMREEEEINGLIDSFNSSLAVDGKVYRVPTFGAEFCGCPVCRMIAERGPRTQ